MRMKKFLTICSHSLFVALFLLTGSCNWSRPRLQVDVSEIPMNDVKVHRYDQALFAIPLDRLETGLGQIKPSYPFFLNTDLSDTAKINNLKEYLTNGRTIEFYNASQARFKDLTGLEQNLTDAFRHFIYYFPDAVIPRVYTYISGGEYDHPVQFVDTVLLIALDAYLGTDFKPYGADGLPLYKIVRMEPEFILPGCIRAMEEAYFPVTYPGNMLLDQMVDAGKRLYFVDAMIPDYPDSLKISYTEKQMAWVTANEAQVWAALIENQMLFSSQGSTIRTFLADGPFTAEFSQASPPRLGEYLGWRIVKAYMEENPDVTLQELMDEADSQKILSRSTYKPRK
ncbi:MAG: hypothetical protein IH596_14165 [Bacteroidales bacterium]|nr:hypothetical protein [Bacteroidales bacterium]